MIIMLLWSCWMCEQRFAASTMMACQGCVQNLFLLSMKTGRIRNFNVRFCRLVSDVNSWRQIPEPPVFNSFALRLGNFMAAFQELQLLNVLILLSVTSSNVIIDGVTHRCAFFLLWQVQISEVKSLLKHLGCFLF